MSDTYNIFVITSWRPLRKLFAPLRLIIY